MDANCNKDNAEILARYSREMADRIGGGRKAGPNPTTPHSNGSTVQCGGAKLQQWQIIHSGDVTTMEEYTIVQYVWRSDSILGG